MATAQRYMRLENYSIPLLIPPNTGNSKWRPLMSSLLANHPEALPHLGALDREQLAWTWTHPDPAMDQLQVDVTRIAQAGANAEDPAELVFSRIQHAASGIDRPLPIPARRAPRMTESWFC